MILHHQPPVRIELTTPGLQDQCSSHWAMEAYISVQKWYIQLCHYIIMHFVVYVLMFPVSWTLVDIYITVQILSQAFRTQFLLVYFQSAYKIHCIKWQTWWQREKFHNIHWYKIKMNLVNSCIKMKKSKCSLDGISD